MFTEGQQASFSVSDMVRNAALRKAELRRQQNPVRLADAGAREFDRCVRQMADDMRDIAGASGCVRDTDLLLRGWTAESIVTFGEAANRHAIALAGEARQ